MTGIYCITNKIDNKKYIGQSRNIKARLRNHINKLRYNTHFNNHLQNAFIKYGAESFNICILEIYDNKISQYDLDENEKMWISAAQSTNQQYGYNLEHGGRNGKYRNTEYAKPRGAKKGHVVSEITKQRISRANKGRKYGPHSAESNKKRSESMKGKKRGPRPQWVVDKVAQGLRGKKYGPQSPEHISKRVEATKKTNEAKNRVGRLADYGADALGL